jgi:hypothetical protein
MEDDPHFEEFKYFYDEIEYQKMQSLKDHVIRIYKHLKPQADKSEIYGLISNLENYIKLNEN